MLKIRNIQLYVCMCKKIYFSLDLLSVLRSFLLNIRSVKTFFCVMIERKGKKTKEHQIQTQIEIYLYKIALGKFVRSFVRPPGQSHPSVAGRTASQGGEAMFPMPPHLHNIQIYRPHLPSVCHKTTHTSLLNTKGTEGKE